MAPDMKRHVSDTFVTGRQIRQQVRWWVNGRKSMEHDTISFPPLPYLCTYIYPSILTSTQHTTAQHTSFPTNHDPPTMSSLPTSTTNQTTWLTNNPTLNTTSNPPPATPPQPQPQPQPPTHNPLPSHPAPPPKTTTTTPQPPHRPMQRTTHPFPRRPTPPPSPKPSSITVPGGTTASLAFYQTALALRVGQIGREGRHAALVYRKLMDGDPEMRYGRLRLRLRLGIDWSGNGRGRGQG